METPKNDYQKTDVQWTGYCLCQTNYVFSQEILAFISQSRNTLGNYNKKILSMGFSTTKLIGRISSRKILNRRVRNRTHGGVRGRNRKMPPTRLQLY